MTRWKESDLLKIQDKVNKPKPEIYIGIDVGTKTGFAVWNAKQKHFFVMETLLIHQAMDRVRRMQEFMNVFVRVEDARMVRYNTDPVKAQGAGSVKRDSQIWFDFLTDLAVPFEMVRPNPKITKWSAEDFSKATGHQGKTSSHARDAAMLVYNF